MHNNSQTIYRFFLALGDIFGLLLSFTAAYILRVSLDSRPITTEIDSTTFITTIIALLPLWVIVFYMLGLYSRHIYDYRPRELSRLFVAAVLGIMLMISFSFFTNIPLFPAKMVAIYALAISFVVLTVIRSLIRISRFITLDARKGLRRLVIIGDNEATVSLVTYLASNPRSGYEIVGVMATERYVVPTISHKYVDSLDEVFEKLKPDVIMQTDSKQSDKIYELAVNNHIEYQFVPMHEALVTTKHTAEIVGTLPVIIVQTTPLAGYGQVIKRFVDIVGAFLAIVVSSPIWLLTIVLMKLTEPTSPIFFKQERLSRFNNPVHVYKFRTHKKAYNGLSPEEAFEKIGKPELAKAYRDGGDQLPDDPRVSTFGRFLRRTSIDELPQLLNVLRGDISLVGPRALVPSELKQYPKKHLILTVKSGLTGLAQISGRRDISFEDRRALDVYYVHNWSLWLDIQIIFKTVWHVLFRKGAI